MRRRIDAKRVMRADVLVLVMLCAFLLMTVPLLFARTREAEVRVLTAPCPAPAGRPQYGVTRGTGRRSTATTPSV